MSNNTFTITNKTRRLGWGYTTGVYQGYPQYEGTARQIMEAICTDKTFASIRMSGAYYSTALFYKGKRIELVDEFSEYSVMRALNFLTSRTDWFGFDVRYAEEK